MKTTYQIIVGLLVSLLLPTYALDVEEYPIIKIVDGEIRVETKPGQYKWPRFLAVSHDNENWSRIGDNPGMISETLYNEETEVSTVVMSRNAPPCCFFRLEAEKIGPIRHMYYRAGQFTASRAFRSIMTLLHWEGHVVSSPFGREKFYSNSWFEARIVDYIVANDVPYEWPLFASGRATNESFFALGQSLTDADGNPLLSTLAAMNSATSGN